MSDDQTADQTEAELERTRKVVAAAMAEQIATNDAAASVTPEADAPEDSEAAATEAPRGNASRDEWAAYATARGHDIDDEWSRDDIRDLFAEES
jgi:hypothetical protein